MRTSRMDLERNCGRIFSLFHRIGLYYIYEKFPILFLLLCFLFLFFFFEKNIIRRARAFGNLRKRKSNKWSYLSKTQHEVGRPIHFLTFPSIARCVYMKGTKRVSYKLKNKVGTQVVHCCCCCLCTRFDNTFLGYSCRVTKGQFTKSFGISFHRRLSPYC